MAFTGQSYRTDVRLPLDRRTTTSEIRGALGTDRNLRSIVFDSTHYVPLLKGKAAEFESLAVVLEETRDRLTPLVDLPPVPIDFVTGELAKSLDEHLAGVPPRLCKGWGYKRRLFLDAGLVSDRQLADGRHPVQYLAAEADLENAFRPVFVTGLRRPADYTAVVAEAAQMSGEGVVLRLEKDDFGEAKVMGDSVDAVLKELGIAPGAADLIIDLSELNASDTSMLVWLARTLISSLPYVHDWRTLTLAGSAFPRYMTGGRDSITFEPRTEWLVWDSLYADRDTLMRMPTYGDYAIAHPGPVEEGFDPRYMTISAQLRYTSAAAWVMVKGRSTKDAGFDQMRDLCGRLVARPEYSGPEFSWGDGYIDRCATSAEGPGNATTWRKIGTSHHIEFVTGQIATLTGS